ncbi:MAG: hypothetical protein M3R02_26260, partial [Chloroflexota bacterium]|nr:hypothetical protein [Chloroflexota bacterium]
HAARRRGAGPCRASGQVDDETGPQYPGRFLPQPPLSQMQLPWVPGLMANLNAVVFDFATRQKVGGTHIKYFTVKQLPVLPPSAYTSVLVDQILPRVLELVYTAHDLAPFARDCGYDGPPFVWEVDRRAHLRFDLDGIYARLYGLDRDDFAYILDTFPIVRRKDEAAFGEYRTKRLCLEAYDRFSNLAAPAAATGLAIAR